MEGLHDDVENLAFVVDGTPEIMDLAADPPEDLVEMPSVRGPRAPLSDQLCIASAEFQKPPAHGLVGRIHAALGEQILYVAIAEGEAEVESDRVLDDHGREAMAGVGKFAHASR